MWDCSGFLQIRSHIIVLSLYTNHYTTEASFKLELTQTSEISRYLFETHYLDTDLELLRIMANYFKKFWNIATLHVKAILRLLTMFEVNNSIINTYAIYACAQTTII